MSTESIDIPRSESLPEDVRVTWADQDEALYLLRCGLTKLYKLTVGGCLEKRKFNNRNIYSRASIKRFKRSLLK